MTWRTFLRVHWPALLAADLSCPHCSFEAAACQSNTTMIGLLLCILENASPYSGSPPKPLPLTPTTEGPRRAAWGG